MKPFLGIDLTTDKKNETINGDEFITKTPSAALDAALDRANDNAIELLDRAKLPLAVRIIGWIFVGLAVVLIGGIVSAWGESEELTLSNMYANVPWLFWCAGVVIVGAALFLLLDRHRFKTTVEGDEGTMTFDTVESVGVSDRLQPTVAIAEKVSNRQATMSVPSIA